MRKIIGAVVLSLVAFQARATMIVYDPALHVQTAVDQIVDFAKWAETEIQAAATQLNTLNTYENTVLQVERMGDPKTLTANLPGVSNLQTLSEIYSQGMKDVEDWSSYVNPKSWSLTADNILQIYQQPGLPSIIASNGVALGTPQSLIQFNTANYNTAAGAQDTVARLNQKLQAQTQELATATSALQAATTTSAVQKYQGVVASLHAQIAATEAALKQAELSEQLQLQQNNNAQQLAHDAETTAQHMADLQVIDEGPLQGIPVGDLDLTKSVQWGSN
jgi:hypothetical protein